jgi:hypothetical protein
MSAFLVSSHHINALVNAYLDWCNKAADGQKLVNLFYKANMASLYARYGDDALQDGNIENYIFQRELTRNPVSVYKACRCFDYQACEHDDWKKSTAYSELKRIEAEAIRKILPATPWKTSAEEWGIDSPGQKVKSIGGGAILVIEKEV